MHLALVLPLSALDEAPENPLRLPVAAAAPRTARCPLAQPHAAPLSFLPARPSPATSSRQRNFLSRPIPILPRGSGGRDSPSFPPSGSRQFRTSWFHLMQVHCRIETNEEAAL